LVRKSPFTTSPKTVEAPILVVDIESGELERGLFNPRGGSELVVWLLPHKLGSFSRYSKLNAPMPEIFCPFTNSLSLMRNGFFLVVAPV